MLISVTDTHIHRMLANASPELLEKLQCLSALSNTVKEE